LNPAKALLKSVPPNGASRPEGFRHGAWGSTSQWNSTCHFIEKTAHVLAPSLLQAARPNWDFGGARPNGARQATDLRLKVPGSSNSSARLINNWRSANVNFGNSARTLKKLTKTSVSQLITRQFNSEELDASVTGLLGGNAIRNGADSPIAETKSMLSISTSGTRLVQVVP